MFLWYNGGMKSKAFTEEQLNSLSKEMLVKMYLQQYEMLSRISDQNEKLLKQTETLEEKIAVLTQQLFGRKTEKASEMKGQLQFDYDNMAVLNEAEAVLSQEGEAKEPEYEEVVIRRRKTKGKRDEDLSGLPTVIDIHDVPEETLKETFPHGWHELPDEIYRDLEYKPAEFLVHEHHVKVYAGRPDEGILKGDRPPRLLKNSLLSVDLASALFNGKYVNAMPMNRMSDEFRRAGVNLSRQVMSGWMIKISERYLGNVYRWMKKKLLESKLIHCDETPFKVIHPPDKAGKSGKNTKSYMWVYHTCERYGSPPIFLYDYKPGRSSEDLRAFLSGYKGILVTDGYEVYHKVARENPDELRVAGCWCHCKRRFAELVKALDEKKSSMMTASEAVKRISAIYHVENMTKGKTPEEVMANRTQSVKPLVDAYFAWINNLLEQPLDKGGKLYAAINYSHNQEQFLREFLNDPMIPLDNNDAERSIRAFCVGKHNWHVIDNPKGAEASGLLYSIAETAKANGLRPYRYFKYLLEQILLHQDDPPETYITDLLPWSDRLPEDCRQKKQNN